MISSYFVQTTRRTTRGLFEDADYARQRAFFIARPELTPTPLRRLAALAAQLGLRDVWAKDETARFGLNAFKAVGADYAIGSLILEGRLPPGGTLACASEGNHGRAVARAARMAGCPAIVYMASSVAPARVEAIESEGATVVRTAATYDDAVHQMAEDAERHQWTVISDTAWPGYEDIPRRIMLGYTRLMDETREAWSPDETPDAVFVQGGVGGLLGAIASWCQWTWGDRTPAIVCVEPSRAACLQVSARAGTPARVDGPLDTIMTGLRCGEVSPVGFDAAYGIVRVWLAIDDGWAMEGMRRLAQPAGDDPPIRAGASGAAALGGMLAVMQDPDLHDVKAHLALGPSSRVLVFVTEGVTDPAAFARIIAEA